MLTPSPFCKLGHGFPTSLSRTQAVNGVGGVMTWLYSEMSPLKWLHKRQAAFKPLLLACTINKQAQIFFPPQQTNLCFPHAYLGDGEKKSLICLLEICLLIYLESELAGGLATHPERDPFNPQCDRKIAFHLLWHGSLPDASRCFILSTIKTNVCAELSGC